MKKYQFSPEVTALLDKLPIPFAVYQWFNHKVVTIFVSQPCVQVLGFQDREEAFYVLDHDMYRDVHPEDAARSADQAYRFASEGRTYFNSVYRNRTKDQDDYHFIHALGSHATMPDGTRLAFVCYVDETAAMEGEKNLAGHKLQETVQENMHFSEVVRRNNYDDLTGLPKMTYFFQLAHAWRPEILANGGHPAMLYIDISGMKYYNHHYGFSAGDHLIQVLGQLLRKYFGAENAGRFGEDHFAVFTDGRDVVDKLNAFFAEWQQVHHGNPLPLRVGIYEDEQNSTSSSIACDRAKFACDSVRNMEQSQYRYFTPEMLAYTQNKEYVLNHFEQAIREKWIHAYYQPIVEAKTGKLCNKEALARWDDPKMGLLAPYRFITVLEEEGLLYKLDLYMVDQIIAYQKRRLERWLPVVPISINFSERDFLACDIVKEVTQRLQKAGLSQDALIIEITEHSIGKEPELLQEVIHEFHAAGFSVWLDDFGSEYSSLNILQDYQFELIKLDMKFLRKVSVNPMSRLIIKKVLELAQEAQIETICEGVETKEQADFLRQAGCTKFQGYLYGKPAPADI